VSISRELCGTSSLPESQHHCDTEKEQTNEIDVEMGSNSGNMEVHSNSGLCLVRSSDVFTNCLISSEEPAVPRGRIPRPLDDMEPSHNNLNHSDNTSIVSTQVALLPTRSRIKRILLTLRDTLQTSFSSFGLCRLYPRRPSFEPDWFIPSLLLTKTSPIAIKGTDPAPNVFAPPYPFPNMMIYRLMSWMNTGSHLISETKVSHLVKDVILANDFDCEHLKKFSVRRSLRELDKDDKGRKVTFPDDWVETDVTINIPMKLKEDAPHPYTINGFHYRPLVEVIRAAFADVQARAFHLLPFQRLWKDPLDGHQERIVDELYTSDTWIEAQDKLLKEPGCSLERVIAGLMFFSDATHLANFGTAKAWPLYLYFRNLTKYARSSPQSGACHLVGFLPSVSPL
jgi:hypothetical protein